MEKETEISFLDSFLNVFADDLSDDLLNAAREYRILDFSISEGRATAKVHKTNVRTQKIELKLSTYDDTIWSNVFDSLSEQAYYFAILLSQSYSPELKQLLSKFTEEILTKSKAIEVYVNDRKQKHLCEASGAVLLKLANAVDSSPWELFLLFGRGKEEAILELHQRRRQQLASRNSKNTKNRSNSVEDELKASLKDSVQEFWNYGKEIESLTYIIRADELPAATFKRLDPLPLYGLEEKVEQNLEESYERIARLAQSYGLSL